MNNREKLKPEYLGLPRIIKSRNINELEFYKKDLILNCYFEKTVNNKIIKSDADMIDYKIMYYDHYGSYNAILFSPFCIKDKPSSEELWFMVFDSINKLKTDLICFNDIKEEIYKVLDFTGLAQHNNSLDKPSLSVPVITNNSSPDILKVIFNKWHSAIIENSINTEVSDIVKIKKSKKEHKKI